ncbi:hypothetical protein [Christiangramia crocea]|uniref:Uncharacterized protein n=1 Tax=Christiangramia crocea TaxID=2904124 RepID=A0A9X1UX51_9FLAO|nr:hypothetical protein [Gramella crocea]MCG9971967.1 hypothetical protein [Gramella crocea]
MKAQKKSGWLLRIVLLIILYVPIWVSGTLVITHLDPDFPSEPGLVDTGMGVFILSIINTLLIVGLIVSSNLRGFRLALLLGIAYYGVFTFLTQIETWYFLGELNVSKELLFELLLMGLPVPFLFIPLAVFLCGRWKAQKNIISNDSLNLHMSELILKIFILAVVYVLIYWLAGYFIAWQNPQLREFYGSPGEIVPFWKHTFSTMINDPGLFILQIMRGSLFTLIAFSIIRNSNVSRWITALLIGLFLAAPHFGHILSNPLMPLASVRLSHMIETASSTFVYGVIIVMVLYRKNNAVKDL